MANPYNGGSRLSNEVQVIWVLLGSKAGDNAQVLHIARALGLPFETKTLVMRPEYDIGKPAVDASLDHLDAMRSDKLDPPWPDLVLAIGRRLAMAALWVKKQSNRRTKIALIGLPKGRSGDFDLIVAPVQYKAPHAPNICRIGLPLMKISDERLATAAALWQPRLASLPKPLTALLVGGSTGARPFKEGAAASLLSRTRAILGRGSLYAVTSRRTPPEVVSAVRKSVGQNGRFHAWQAAGADNPYLGLLALADRFVVTGDSISMLVEVARLGKPLAIAEFDSRGWFARWFSNESRSFRALHDYLYSGGWAVRLGDPFAAPRNPPPDDTQVVVDRLKALFVKS
jgi:mitochondrial fission protein ELM1